MTGAREPRPTTGIDIASPFPADCAAKFRALKHLGAGSFGDVYLAEQITLQRHVAIKILSRDVLGEVAQHERFLEEARITGALRSPHIVRMIDCGAGADRPWIAFEYVEGKPLRVGTDHRRDVVQILDFGLQMAAALAEAHAMGIVHRDLKPDNILHQLQKTLPTSFPAAADERSLPTSFPLPAGGAEEGDRQESLPTSSPTPAAGVEDGNDLYKVVDFGIAKWIPDSRVATEAGIVLGTPRYMPPEVLRGAPSSPVWDVYSIGVVMMELALGTLPFPMDLVGILRAKQDRQLLVDAIAASDLPAPVRRLLEAAVASDPDARPADGEALLGRVRDTADVLETARVRRSTVRAGEGMEVRGARGASAKDDGTAVAADREEIAARLASADRDGGSPSHAGIGGNRGHPDTGIGASRDELAVQPAVRSDERRRVPGDSPSGRVSTATHEARPPSGSQGDIARDLGHGAPLLRRSYTFVLFFGLAILLGLGLLPFIMRPDPRTFAAGDDVTSVTVAPAAGASARFQLLAEIPAGFVPRCVVDRRKECRELSQRAADVTPAVWETGSVDFFMDPRRGEPPEMPEEAILELEISGEIPGGPAPALVLDGRALGDLPAAALGGGTIRLAVPASMLLPGINRVSVRRDPADPRISRRLTRLALHTRGGRPAGDVRHFFAPASAASVPRPPKPPAWEKMMVAKGNQMEDLLVNLCTQELTGDPSNPWTRWSLACGLDRLDQPSEAMPSYAMASEVARHEVWVLSDTGRCLSKLERYDEAELFLECAIERAQQSKNHGCVHWSAKNLAENARARGDTAHMRAMMRLAEEATRLDEEAHPGAQTKEDIRNVADFLRTK